MLLDTAWFTLQVIDKIIGQFPMDSVACDSVSYLYTKG